MGRSLGLGMSVLGGLLAVLISSLIAASAWAQSSLEQLLPVDGATDDWFGFAVSLSSNGYTALVGSYGDDDNGLNSGSAYIFTRDAVTGVWTEQEKLLPADGQPGDSFGSSVSLSSTGNTALVGARGDSNRGSAYVFTRDAVTGAWTEQQKFRGNYGPGGNRFGWSVSLSSTGDTALVGDGNDDSPTDSGSAYVWTRDAVTGLWTFRAKLLHSDRSAYDWFGRSVSLSSNGDTALVGASGDDDNGLNSGSAYIFTRDAVTGAWAEQEKLLPADSAAVAEFGWSVSLSSNGDTAIIGARRDDGNGAESGSAYFYVPEPTLGCGIGLGVLGLIGMRRGRERAKSEGRAK